MSEAKSVGGHSAACCSVPPIVATGYQAKGRYEEIDGKKTYITGPKDTTKGVLYLMDIFGFFDQTLQGADIIATSDHQHKYQVFVPNWYDKGEPADISWFPPDNKDKEAKLGDFFKRSAPPSVAESIPQLFKAIQKQYPGITSWAIVGFCAGAKIVSLSVQKGKGLPFAVAAACHPAMVDPEDAASISIPFAMLASKDEPADQVKEFVQKLPGDKMSETFDTQIHGWMAARSNLQDDKVMQEYKRGYTTVVEWFGKYIK